tara:strand:- start:4205 stop:4381 length:177 start_codon:yes stop_codon:yes gene_type:complete
VNNTFTITDNITRKKLKITFSEFYDLIIGCKCAVDMYDGDSRSRDFKTLSKKLIKVSE